MNKGRLTFARLVLWLTLAHIILDGLTQTLDQILVVFKNHQVEIERYVQSK